MAIVNIFTSVSKIYSGKQRLCITSLVVRIVLHNISILSMDIKVFLYKSYFFFGIDEYLKKKICPIIQEHHALA